MKRTLQCIAAQAGAGTNGGPRAPWGVALAWAALSGLAPAVPAPATAPATAPGPQQDDHKARWHNFNVEPATGVAWSDDSSTVYLLHSSGQRLVAADRASGDLLWSMPVGPGPAGLAFRPGTDQLWVTDRVAGTVSVVDVTTRRLLASTPVGAEPHGIAFHPDGQRCWVACSGDRRVDVLRCDTLQVVNSIEIPAREPRALLHSGDSVFVISHLSGNGTAPIGFAGSAGEGPAERVVPADAQTGGTPLPDRDLFRIVVTAAPETDQLDPARTRSGLGTTLFNVHLGPGGQLWVPHTEALNGQFRGEKAFPDGQVVRNRVALVDPGSLAPPAFLDLDALTPGPSQRCAPCTAVVFAPDGTRAYLAGYGSDNVTVLDLGGGTPVWRGEIEIEQYRSNPQISTLEEQSGAGPRLMALSPDGATLAVLNTGESSFTLIDLATLPVRGGFTVHAPVATPLGWDPLPPEMVQGRIDFANTRHSRSGTSSCASCHDGGHTDHLAWDLGLFLDAESTPAGALAHPTDDKGPLVTQSTRRLREVGPWHWRGEKRNLFEFDGTFPNLLEREVNGQTQGLGIQVNYLVRYMESLAWPANPRQELDRGLTPAQEAGRDLFLNEPVLGDLTCASCHTLPLGTNGEVLSHELGGKAPTGVVPSLRGVGDKAVLPPFFVGGDFGWRTETGAGLGHTGSFATLQAHLLQVTEDGSPRLDLTVAEADQIAAYLEVFDTGLAPSTAFLVTADAQNALDVRANELAFLLGQAQAGHCDVIFHAGPMDWNGQEVWVGGLYDPATGLFRRSSSTLLDLDPDLAIRIAQQGVPVTFQGVPRWAGYPRALDRDLDGLLDLDELDQGTDPENFDTDQDSRPDGYELLHGTDPLVDDAPSGDGQAPSIVGGVQVVYVTQNTVKFEFVTDELARVSAGVDGEVPQLRAPLKPLYDDHFSLIVNLLEPDTAYTFRLSLRDPSGNVSEETFQATTLPRVQGTPVHLEEGAMMVSGGAQPVVHVRLRLADSDGLPAPAGYSVIGALYHVSPTGVTTVKSPMQGWAVLADGNAHLWTPLPAGLTPGSGQLVFALQEVLAPSGAPTYVQAENQQGPLTTPW